MAIKPFNGIPLITFEFMSGESIIFEPREDITPFELATLMPYLMAGGKDGFWGFEASQLTDILPVALKRHFSKIINTR